MPRITFRKKPLEQYARCFEPSFTVSIDGRPVADLRPYTDGAMYYWTTRLGGWRNTAAEKDARPLEEAKAQLKEHLLAMHAAGAKET